MRPGHRIDGVDIFEFSESRKKFRKLTVIYDATKVSASRLGASFDCGVVLSPSAAGDETRLHHFELNFDLPPQGA